MKWLTYKTWKHKHRSLKRWHVWFAWYPICINYLEDGIEERIWFENVLRCGERHLDFEGSFWTWKYKEINKEN